MMIPTCCSLVLGPCMRGRPLKKPALDGAKIAALRQDLALQALWIPLHQAAENANQVKSHDSRGFAPPYELRYDGRGAAFMARHTRMVAAPEEREMSVGFPRAWTSVLYARYHTLEPGSIDATALLVVRLMCECPVELMDRAMCELAAGLVRDSGCSVGQALRRCYFLLERIMATSIHSPAYDLGEMVLWVWGQRYIASHCRFELAVYHELGLGYHAMHDDYRTHSRYVPTQLWPCAGSEVLRTELDRVHEFNNHSRYELVELVPVRSQYQAIVGRGLVYYSLLEWAYEHADFPLFAALARTSRDFAQLARWIVAHKFRVDSAGLAELPVDNLVYRAAELMPYRTFGVKWGNGRQDRFIWACNAVVELVGKAQKAAQYAWVPQNVY